MSQAEKSSGLRAKWFGGKRRNKPQVEQEPEMVDDSVTWAAMVNTRSFGELIEWMERTAETYRPQPSADVGVMNYQLGVRDGIDMVTKHCQSLVRQARENNDE